jgi:hypothetical protein
MKGDQGVLRLGLAAPAIVARTRHHRRLKLFHLHSWQTDEQIVQNPDTCEDFAAHCNRLELTPFRNCAQDSGEKNAVLQSSQIMLKYSIELKLGLRA